jgi:hypothetical protein
VRRYSRLAAPGLAFAAIGGLLLVLAGRPAFALVGGLKTSGAYALALQVVLASFLLAAVDDLRQPFTADPHDYEPDRATPSTAHATSHIRHALPRFYLCRPLPASLLAFGLATSLAALLIGSLDPARVVHLDDAGSVSLSEAVLAALLIVSSLAQLPVLDRGFFGWCVGFGAGCFVALRQFERDAGVAPNPFTWLALVVGLVVVGGIVYGFTASASWRGASVDETRAMDG